MIGQRNTNQRLRPGGRAGVYAPQRVMATGSARNNNIFILGSALLIVVFLGIAGSITRDIDYKAPMYTLLGLVGLATVMGGEESLMVGFYGFIAAFGLGYRTVSLTPRLKIHPGEILILALFVLLFTARRSRAAVAQRIMIPAWMFAMLPFWIWGWFRGIGERYAWDDMLSESRQFFMLIPIVIVSGIMLNSKDRWRTAIGVLYVTSTWIAFWGVAEFYFPGVKNVIPGFVTKTGGKLTSEGFDRASFSFWGNPAGTFLCAMAVPLAIPLFRWHTKKAHQWALRGMMAVQLAGVYVGGFRILWTCLVVQFVLYSVLKKRVGMAVFALVTVVASYNFIPQKTQERFETFLDVVSGSPSTHDTSGKKHLDRLEEAVSLAINNPGGVGWTGAGWVHCDFVQIAANLGMLGGLVYLLSYVTTLFRMIGMISMSRGNPEYRDVLIAVLLGYTTVGALLFTQAVSVLPQLAFPAWFYWVMTEILSRRRDFERRKPIAPPSNSAAANREFGGYRPQYAGVRSLG